MIDAKPNHAELSRAAMRTLLPSARSVVSTPELWAEWLRNAHTPTALHVLTRAVVEAALDDLGPSTPFGVVVEHAAIAYYRDFLLMVAAPYAHTQAGENWRDMLQQETRASLFAHLHPVIFERCGSHSYWLSEGLGARLAATELRGLRADDLKLPYPSIYLEVPHRLDLKVPRQYPTPCFFPLHGIYVREEVSDTRRWFLYAVANAESRAIDGVTDATFSSSVPLRPGATLDEAVEEVVERMRTRADYGPEMEHEWKRIFAWVLNVIVYATWPEAEREELIGNPAARALEERLTRAPKGHPRRRKILDELKGVDPRRRTVLGRSIRILDRDTRHASESGTGRPLVRRVLVAGHWRHQPYGPRDQGLRRLQWIAPFWRGPELGEVDSAVLHVLDES